MYTNGDKVVRGDVLVRSLLNVLMPALMLLTESSMAFVTKLR
jgi:hypothetical protein